jgi:glycosyltransferase involved in cell wall biosynthesis
LSLSRLKYSFRVNHYIAISGAVRDTLIEGGVGPEKISIVHSGVEPPGVKEGGESDIDLRAELGISPGDRIVATVGALARNKGHRCLIEAAPLVMEKVPGARFVFFGEGGLRAELEALVSQSGLKNAIIFAGFRVEVNALLKQVDVVAAPSHMEGLNTSIVDALMAERPVVATRVGGIPEIIEDGATGLLVPPKDAESLAGAIVELLENPEKASQLASAGKKAALEKFTTDRMVDGTVAVYEELLKDR